MEAKSFQHKLVAILMQKFGFAIIDYTSIRLVSQQLRPEFKISENTLARMAGLRADGRTHYQHTLDEVAKAAGFLSYEKYEQIIRSNSKLQINISEHKHSSLLTSYASIAVKENEFRYLNHLVSYIEEKGISIPEYFELGEHILHGMRQNKEPEKMIQCLVSHPTLVDLFLKWWVDMDYLDQYYGKAMQELSKIQYQSNSDYFFSHTIAFDYEWKNKLEQQCIHRAGELSEIALSEIIKLIEQHAIFPAARWLKVVLIYYHHTRNHQKMNDLLEFGFCLIQTLQPDEAMIIISQLSELGTRLPIHYKESIEKLYLRFKKNVKTEMDSLANAGLNLQRYNIQKELISIQEAQHLIQNHPNQIFCSRNSLIKKIRQIKH